MLLAGDLFAVTVAEQDGYSDVRGGPVIVSMLIDIYAETFEFHRLARAVNRAVGEKYGPIVRSRIVDSVAIAVVICGTKLLVGLARKNEIAAVNGLKLEMTISIRGGWVYFLACISVTCPGSDVCAGNRLSALSV